jgi:hypothetical protein
VSLAACDEHNAEMGSHSHGFRVQCEHLVRSSICCNIVIFRDHAEQEIADASTHKIGLKIVRTQVGDDLPGDGAFLGLHDSIIA